MRNWSIVETPYPRNVIRLLEILSPEKVARLIDAAELPFYPSFWFYGTGARGAGSGTSEGQRYRQAYRLPGMIVRSDPA
jgi:hypothetical protein